MSRSRFVFRALVAASIAAAVPFTQTMGERTAQAQPAKGHKPAKGDKKQQAKAYVDSGLAAQDAGDYDTALSFYGKAYELVPHPVLLFNMAQVHRLAGRAELARDLYRQYLEAEPNGAKAKTARELLTALDAQIAAAQRPAGAGAGATAEPNRPAGAGVSGEPGKPAGAGTSGEPGKPAGPSGAGASLEPGKPAGPGQPKTTAADEGSRGRKLRLAGFITGGVGLASLGAGVAFQLRASSISDDLSKPGTTYDPGKASDGESAERLMYVAYAAGGALVIGGAALYFLGKRARGERVALLPAISSDSVGLVVTGGLP